LLESAISHGATTVLAVGIVGIGERVAVVVQAVAAGVGSCLLFRLQRYSQALAGLADVSEAARVTIIAGAVFGIGSCTIPVFLATGLPAIIVTVWSGTGVLSRAAHAILTGLLTVAEEFVFTGSTGQVCFLTIVGGLVAAIGGTGITVVAVAILLAGSAVGVVAIGKAVAVVVTAIAAAGIVARAFLAGPGHQTVAAAEAVLLADVGGTFVVVVAVAVVAAFVCETVAVVIPLVVQVLGLGAAAATASGVTGTVEGQGNACPLAGALRDTGAIEDDAVLVTGLREEDQIPGGNLL